MEPQSDPTLIFSPVLTFGRFDERLFYGFLGRTSSTGQLAGLGIISYEPGCLDKAIADQAGEDFAWSEVIREELIAEAEEKAKEEEENQDGEDGD